MCPTSGERRVQLLVEEPLLPVLLLLSDIALCRLHLAQHGADAAFFYPADDDKKNVSSLNTPNSRTKMSFGS